MVNSKNKKKNFLLVVLACSLATLYSLSLVGGIQESGAVSSSPPKKQQAAALPLALEQTFSKSPSQQEVKKNANARFSTPLVTSSATPLNTPPSVEQIRLEVLKNPHQTPSSILEFAAKLGPKMKHAFEFEETATQLFEELQLCALNQSLPFVIQAICIKNSEILSEKYPKFEGDFKLIQAQASPDVLNLL